MDTIESALTADAIVQKTTGSGFAADAIRKVAGGRTSAANVSPYGNINIGSVVTETLIPGTLLDIHTTLYYGPVAVSWDIWFSHDQYGTFKHEVIYLRRDGVAGEILATIDPQGGGGDAGDSANGHQWHATGTLTDYATTGVYVLTMVAIAGSADIWSDTRIFSAGYGSDDFLPISAAAIKWRVMFSSRTIDALIAPGRRNTHDRGTPPHYDNDLDTFIVLSKALGVYQQGMDLHAVLTAVADRVSVLEARL